MSRKRILVALDHAQTSEAVFAAALTLAQQNQAALMLVHVLSPFDADYPVQVYPTVDTLYPAMYEAAMKVYDETWKRYEAGGANLLRYLCHRAREAGLIAEFSQVLGEPGKMICAIAETWEADLIVLGRRGRTGLSEWWLGSVSNYVLHHAPCSVLTLQEKKLTQPDPRSSQKEAVPS